MSMGILSDEQAAAYGRFDGAPSRAELERFFFLDDIDQQLVGRRRGGHNWLGFALQLGTVQFLGTFLPDPLDVPGLVVEYLGGQPGVADPSVVKAYAERLTTQWEQAASRPVLAPRAHCLSAGSHPNSYATRAWPEVAADNIPGP